MNTLRTARAPYVLALLLTIVGLFSAAAAAHAGGPAPTPRDLHIMTACRVYDSRLTGGPLASGVVRDVDLPAACGIPDDAVSVIVNLTVVNPPTDGYIQVYQGGTTPPMANALVFQTGEILGQLYVVKVGTAPASDLQVRPSMGAGVTHFVIDVLAFNGSGAPSDILLDNASVQENRPVGTLVGNLSTTDPDFDDTHTYSLVAGTGSTDNAKFQISGSQLQTNAILDLKTQETYSIRVRGTDNFGVFFEKVFTITATNENEAPTNITLSPTSVNEGLPIGTLVGTFTTADVDLGDTHTYAFVADPQGPDNGSFQISGNQLLTNAVFDREVKSSYTIYVSTTDSGALAFNKQFIVTIDDVNDPPAPSGGPFSVAENSAAATVVGTVAANDPDAGQTHTFAITAGNTGGAFAISNAGVITVANSAALNFETTPTFSLTVQATDNGTPVQSGSGTVVVNLTDVNEAPVPSGGPFSVAENSATGTTVGTVTFTDQDTGQSHTFAITAGNTGGAFSIDSAGVIKVATPAALDFETTPTFSLTVQVTDNGTPVLSGSTTVVVNLTDANDAPVPSGGPFSVAENSANGTTVGTVTFNDQDTGQSHTFAITAGNTGGAFAIDGSGVITVASSAALNFETTPTFNLTVQVTDNGTPVLSGSTTVVVNLSDVNEPPVPSGGPFSVAENSANGTTVGTVLAGDPDGGQSHTFSITAGNTGGAFAINSSGVITVATSAALNFETTPAFNLTVQVTDNGTPILSGSTTVVVNLTNVNEAPAPTGGPCSLAENSANGTTVCTVLPGDQDTGQTYTFAITAGNTGGAFAINSSGVITVATSAALNFETTPTFNLTVQVTDNGTPVLSGSTTVVVNLTDVNEPPVPSGGPCSVAENSPNGTTVCTVLAGDQDGGQSHTFAITAGNTGGAFAINGSGVITVANSAVLNFEATPTFSLTVQVTDNGTPILSGSATVVVNLTNVNEAPVPSGGPFTIPENSANGTNVGTVLANDPDVGQSHTFAITAGNTGGAFAINSSGLITVANVTAVNFEATPVFNLTVQVTDNGTPVLSGSTTVTINLLNVPEAPIAGDEGTPASPFADTAGNTLLEMKLAVGDLNAPEPKVTFIGNILANDIDPDGTTTFTVTLESASAGAVVTLHSSNGTFNYVPPPGVTGVDSFTYRITDPSGLFDTGTVYINVKHRIWYVKNNTATAGTAGTTADPFDTLAEAEAAAASGVGDTIYLFEGNGTTAGQSDGIALKNGQRLLGENVQLAVPASVTINGQAGRTLRTTTGNRPKIENDNTPDAAGEDNGVSVAATGGSLTGVEIRGLDIKGFDNAIDVTATGANNADVTISDDVISGSGIEGIDVNANSTGAVTLAISNNSITAGVRGIDVLRTAGTCTIKGFANNVINGNTGGSGVEITGAIFDANPGNPIDQVSGGTMMIGQSGNGVSTNGMLLTNVTGDLVFTDIDIVNDSGAGLSVTSTGALNAGAGTGFRFGVTGSTSTIDSNGGPAINVNNASFNLPTLSFLRSTNSTTTGLSLVNAFGGAGATTLSVPLATSGQISDPAGASGTAVNISGGNGNITLPIPITSTSGNAVVVASRTSDTVSFTGTISDSGSGISLTGNGGSTISFSGQLTLNTGANPAFAATGGGTVTAIDTGSTLTTTTGTALNVANTTIGAGGLHFKSIVSNGAASGIILNNTGTTAGLTVHGTGANNSGGTIQNTTGDGISLASTRNVSLSEMRVFSSNQSNIDASSVTNLTLSSMELDSSTSHGILGNNITNLVINGGTFHRGGADGEPTCNLNGVEITNLLGTSSITGATFTRSNTIQFHVVNSATSSGPDTLTVTGTTWGTHTGPCSGDHLSVAADTGGNLKLITNGSAGENNFQGAGIGIQAAAQGSGNIQASITGVETSGNTAGVAIAATAAGNISFDVYDNRTALGTGFSGTGSVALIMTCTSSGTCQGAFRGNSINHTAGTATNAMQAVVEGDGTGRVQISNNTISGNCQRCLHAQSRAGTGSLSLQVSNNTMTGTDINGLQVMNFEVGASGGGTTNSMCLNLAGNTATPASGMSAYRLLHRTGYTYQLQNLAQASTTNTADVQTWVTTTKANTGTPVSVTIGSSPFTTSAGCATPTLPSP